MKQVLKITILIIVFSFILSSMVLAVDKIFTQSEDWISTGKAHTDTTMDTSNIKKVSNAVFNIFFGVGTAVVIIVGAILGIQFMTAGIDKKVEVKKALVTYVVSSVIFFGSFGIWKLAVTVLQAMS